MKKIAFAVWPAIPGANEIPETLMNVFNRSSKVLDEAGFEVRLMKELHLDDPHVAGMMEYNNRTAKFYSKISDYLRARYLTEFIEEYDEVLYFDLDLYIKRAPTTFGCAMETHIQQDKINNPIDKLWMKGVNCTMYVNKSHKEWVDMHYEWICSYTEGGKPKYAYAQNCMHPFEDKIGYIANYWLFGDTKEELFCTEEKILDCVFLWHHLFGVTPTGIDGCNLMGSREHESVDYMIEQVDRLDEKIRNMNYDDPARFEELMSKFSPNLRLRPNYNSDRTAIKKFKADHLHLMKGLPYITRSE